ncbi:MAG TPA: trypsin-like peptidase domain-containing protein [Marmoricola sp.]|nr:trypsin-like peptidase domain-containing protein [Marmoricola sp.]
MSEYTHRYGDHENTSAMPPYQESAPAGPPPPRRRRGAAAGILVAALLVGGAGGVAGAAGYDAVNEDGATSSTASTRAPLSTTASDTQDTPAPDGSAEAVAASVLPSVVKINVAGPEGARGSGSGVILSEDGEILTNNHVVEVAENGGTVTVNFNDGSGAKAEVVGTDPVTDLAVIKAVDVDGLTPATIGDSDKVDVGEAVVAIGSPFGLEATVTSGIVSAVNRPVSVPSAETPEQPGLPQLPGVPQSGPVASTTYPAIQTDAAINPGNSGGPLVNLAGEVIGINSSIRSATSGLQGGEAGSIGLGFAIPITKVLPIVEQLRAGDTPTHARLGVTVSTSNLEDGLVTGAGIQSVNEGSAAAKAGLEDGDVVTRVDDELIAGSDSLVAVIRGYRPGDEVTLTVVRDGEPQELHVTLDSDLEAADS